MRRSAALLLLLALFTAGYLWWQSARGEADVTAASLIPLLSDEPAAGFARATQPGAVSFPRDLGPHNEYQTEWWYYTGNLQTNEGRPFGFQLTFFRRALTPEESAPDPLNAPDQSSWRTNQIYLAHFTISDVAADAFYPNERFSRGAAGLAGAQAIPYRVWLEDWYAAERAPGVVELHAQTPEVGLDLLLTQTLAPVLHGDGGLSPKGPEPGNASYYYSIVQQQASGSIHVLDQTYEVSGIAWKDHEYSTSALSERAVGWDWFSLQLDDGAALMLFQIRRADGSLEPASSGSYIHADGAVESLSYEDWGLEVLDNWRSPVSGADYPSAWRITIPNLGLRLEGEPMMANQELNVSTVYWEGAVAFEGIVDGRPVRARGYIELTGYADIMTGRF